MNDYGLYIVLAYGVTAAAIGAVSARIILDYRRLLSELERLERSRPERESE
jgi:heme exporter protein CcmD